MLIQLLHAYDYLLVVLLLLPGSNQRSLNTDHLQRKNETAKENAKSIPLLKEVDNFLDGQCPPSTDSLNVNGMNERCEGECKTDVDCIEDYKCCEDGCSFKCVEPWFPNRVVDWTKSPTLNQMSDGLELPDQRNGAWKSGGEPCSTSVLDGLQPFRCPTNHVCQIIMEGDLQLNIPNRGECVKINNKKSVSERINNVNSQDFLTVDAVCSRKEETYKHKEKFRKDCNICVCHNGVIFCDNQPCPSQIGIPASIGNYEEQRRSSQFISIDREDEEDTDDAEDTEDASGSNGGSEESHEARVTYENIKLGANTEGRNEKKSGNGEGVQEADLSFSGDGDVFHSGEDDGRDNDDGASGARVIDLENKGNVSNQEFGGESGSREPKTEAPGITEADTTTKTNESTTAREISTLPTEISTFTRESKTSTPESSTLLPEVSTFATKISTASPKVEQYKTTESLQLVKTTPTEGVIRLVKGVHEASGKSVEEYSGNNNEGSEENSGEDGSVDYSGGENNTEETHNPQTVYPDTIVLAKGIEANQEEEFGFEVDDARTDVVSTTSPSSGELGSGDDGSASGSIVGKNDLKNTEQGSATLEYLKTTDDED